MDLNRGRNKVRFFDGIASSTDKSRCE